MNRAGRFASAAALLVVLLVGFVTLASFAATRAANGDGVIARATQTAALSVAGGVANVATGAVRLAGNVGRSAGQAKDCASMCSPGDAAAASNRLASSDGGKRVASSEGEGGCSFGAAASFLSSGGHGSCDSEASASFASKQGGACTPSSDAALAVATGALTGNFESKLASMCQGACGTDDVDVASVVDQPGAAPGDVTQCPVSGAVFTVGANNPAWDHEGTGYYTCCGHCAGILAENPERFLEI